MIHFSIKYTYKLPLHFVAKVKVKEVVKICKVKGFHVKLFLFVVKYDANVILFR